MLNKTNALSSYLVIIDNSASHLDITQTATRWTSIISFKRYYLIAYLHRTILYIAYSLIYSKNTDQTYFDSMNTF